MKSTLTENELIEQFLLGKLNEKEIRGFKERLEDDREFRRKFRLIKTFPEMMSETGRKELEKITAEALAQKPEKESRHISKTKFLLWTAISLVVLLGAVLFLVLRQKDPEPTGPIAEGNIVPKINIAHSEPVRAGIIKSVDAQKSVQPEKKEIRKTDSVTASGGIELLAPPSGKEFSRKEMLQFRWKMKADTFTRFYIVSETSDKVVLWRGVRPGVREYQVPGSFLYQGKFYWFVGTEDQKRTFVISE